jgi:hypothetical protein
MNVRTNTAQVVPDRARRMALGGSVLLLTLASAASAGPNEQAKRIYERVAGEPPSAAVLAQLENAVCGTNPRPAGSPARPRQPRADRRRCDRHRASATAPTFYNVTLKNFVILPDQPQPDGVCAAQRLRRHRDRMVRDDVAFNALSADLLYDAGARRHLERQQRPLRHGRSHRRGPDSALKSTTRRRPMAREAATAGLLTTYGAEAAFFINGTNRACSASP